MELGIPYIQYTVYYIQAAYHHTTFTRRKTAVRRISSLQMICLGYIIMFLGLETMAEIVILQCHHSNQQNDRNLKQINDAWYTVCTLPVSLPVNSVNSGWSNCTVRKTWPATSNLKMNMNPRLDWRSDSPLQQKINSLEKKTITTVQEPVLINHKKKTSKTSTQTNSGTEHVRHFKQWRK